MIDLRTRVVDQVLEGRANVLTTGRKTVRLYYARDRLEPNVAFSPDGKWAVFRSNMFGATHVFAVEARERARSGCYNGDESPEMTTADARLRVRYAETDQMGIVYYANYFIWMELGRVEWCRAAGIRYRDMEQEDGILLAVAEAACRYSAPARYDDHVVVRTTVRDPSSRMVTFEYRMEREEDGLLLAAGHTKHVFLDKNLSRSRLPRKYFPVFGIQNRSER